MTGLHYNITAEMNALAGEYQEKFVGDPGGRAARVAGDLARRHTFTPGRCWNCATAPQAAASSGLLNFGLNTFKA